MTNDQVEMPRLEIRLPSDATASDVEDLRQWLVRGDTLKVSVKPTRGIESGAPMGGPDALAVIVVVANAVQAIAAVLQWLEARATRTAIVSSASGKSAVVKRGDSAKSVATAIGANDA